MSADTPRDIPLDPGVSQVTTHTETATTGTAGATQVEQASLLPGTIAIMLTVGLLSFAALLCFKEIPVNNQRLVDTLFGGLLVGCTTAWGYFYTSNQASEARSVLRITKGTP